MKPTQLPSGSWRCQVYLGKDSTGKKQFQSITRPNKHDCIIEAERLAKYHHESERDNSLLTLKDAIDRYLELKDSILSPSTIRCYENIKKSHLQSLMSLQLKQFTKNIIQQAINEESKVYAPKTVENVYRLLTAVLNQFTDAPLPNIQLKEQSEREVNTLTDEQMLTLITALQGDKSEIPLLLALFLGLRRSEIMALTHKDFDPITNIITINKALVPDKNGEYVLKSPKTKKGQRKISVPPYLAEKLKSCIDRGEPFFNVQPERPYKRLQQLCEKYNLPKMSLHDLRHQNASIMLYLNIPDKYAMERGGWASNHVMKSVYQHTMSPERKNIDHVINEYFENLIKRESM